uniref:Glutamate receptor n=1 Tax=Tanacetum cinerariifolium TaxID=118510 RepID=A0A6L2P5N4_TANCI|nr:extracellular ligand-binding receptor [Tanacetum cinerariifolium]
MKCGLFRDESQVFNLTVKKICSKAQEDSSYKEIPVGVILDMGSWVGKTVHSCMTMALSDFYTVNSHYKTRIVLHSRDTHGEPLHALSAALDLLEKPKVKAIIGSESTTEAKLLAVLGDEARVPILSLSPTPSANKHPYFLQITQDETTQFKGIAALAELLKWKNVMFISEDTDVRRDMEPIMINALKDKNITVTYISLISISASSQSIQKELHKLSTMATKNYIMHTSHSLASHVLINAKYLGMMDAGYKWIITSKTMDFLNFMDGEVIESMQGAVGFKSYIPQSMDLHKVTSEWRKEHHALNPLMKRKKLNPYGIWAYDAVSAVAMATERTQTEQVLKSNMKKWETSLLDQLFRISFHGLVGTFQLLNGRSSTQVLEIIKVIGKRERRVGLWTEDAGFTRKIVKLNLFPDIIWPGGFCAEVFRAAFNALAHDVAFEFIPFMKETEVGKVNYNDLIDRVHDREFDAAIGDITITSNRSKYVDFTLPFTDVGYATLSRNADTNIWIFMKPLGSDLWVVSACFFILLGFVIWILEHRVNEEFQGSAAQQIGTTFWFAFSTLVYAHREKLQSNLSRFVVIVWLFVVLVLVSSYTATLSSLLTVEQIQLASKRGSIGYNSGSVFQGTLVRNLNFQDTRLKPYNSAEEYADALSRGSKRGGVDAVVDEIPYIKEFLADYPSGYSMTVSKITSNGFGFAFPKGSSLAPEMSIQIAKLREDGTLKLLEDKWFNEQSDSLSEPKILNLEGFRGLFLISGVSMASALFLFMIYFIHEKVNFTYTMLRGGKLAFIMRFLEPRFANAV